MDRLPNHYCHFTIFFSFSRLPHPYSNSCLFLTFYQYFKTGACFFPLGYSGYHHYRILQIRQIHFCRKSIHLDHKMSHLADYKIPNHRKIHLQFLECFLL